MDEKPYTLVSKEGREEKYSIKLKTENNIDLQESLTTNTISCKTEIIKREGETDIIEDIKTEISGEKPSQSGLLAICGLCKEQFTSEREFIEHRSERCSFVKKEPTVSNLNDEQDPGSRLLDEINEDTVFQQEVAERKAPLHKRSHEKRLREKEPLTCKFCEKFFTDRGNLTVHERTHTGETPFHCKYCSESFNRTRQLKLHERVHTGENPFCCKICSKSFTTGRSLRDHENIHTGERPFLCKICSKSFNRICNMKLHERSHTGEKPFQCEICSKSFTRANSLRVHERIHTGVTPYRCEICSASFWYEATLKAHQSCHGEAPVQC